MWIISTREGVRSGGGGATRRTKTREENRNVNKRYCWILVKTSGLPVRWCSQQPHPKSGRANKSALACDDEGKSKVLSFTSRGKYYQ